MMYRSWSCNIKLSGNAVQIVELQHQTHRKFYTDRGIRQHQTQRTTVQIVELQHHTQRKFYTDRGTRQHQTQQKCCTDRGAATLNSVQITRRKGMEGIVTEQLGHTPPPHPRSPSGLTWNMAPGKIQ